MLDPFSEKKKKILKTLVRAAAASYHCLRNWSYCVHLVCGSAAWRSWYWWSAWSTGWSWSEFAASTACAHCVFCWSGRRNQVRNNQGNGLPATPWTSSAQGRGGQRSKGHRPVNRYQPLWGTGTKWPTGWRRSPHRGLKTPVVRYRPVTKESLILTSGEAGGEMERGDKDLWEKENIKHMEYMFKICAIYTISVYKSICCMVSYFNKYIYFTYIVQHYNMCAIYVQYVYNICSIYVQYACNIYYLIF